MQAEDYIRDGNLQGALQTLQDAVRKQPAKAELRTFLFQLLSVLGSWDRALTQLNVVGELDSLAIPMVQTYQSALASEALRHEVHLGRRRPLVFGEPEQWLALMLEALALDGQGKSDEAQATRNQAFESAPASSGTIDGDAFEWIADCDQRLGPILEVVMNGHFYWVPFHRIQRIEFDAPEDLRDFVWLPAHFTWSNGGDAVGLVPSRYPQSHEADDDAIKLARKTDWVESGDNVYLGLGQRMLATDANEYPLLDIREIILDTAAAATEDPPSEDH